MDFGELRMDSTDLLDLLNDHASPDNNMPFDHNSLEAYLDHLNDPTTVKEEPEDGCSGFDAMLPSSPLVEGATHLGRSDDDYGLDIPMENVLSSPAEDCAADEPTGAGAVLPVVTTGALQIKKASSRTKQEQKKNKRSRRVRTPKQQELNRLAQQRYRERKKQKYTSLQQAVDALSVQLDKVAVVEEERDNLQADNDELQQQLKAQNQKVHARDTLIRQQQKQLDSQQLEITALKQRLGALTAAENSSTDTRMLQQLAAAIKTAFEENECSSAQMALHQFPELLLENISNTVRQCCRDRAAEPVVVKPMPTVVQVSCC